MADMLQSGVAWLNDQLQANASQTVAYARPNSALSIAELTVTPGQPREDEFINEAGVVTKLRRRDFLVSVDLLVLGGTPVPPARGDRITWGSAVYEVASDGAETPWRYSDPYQTIYRINTLQVT